ncbi:SCO family protein [Aquibacillus sediminis]|uniref:SCO family protein n=1 Tax=Aquibacillus sediminis TaxID=2574734 RepID=UPI001109BED2|nr:SCO family protein [Aquibacillus sediminis]
MIQNKQNLIAISLVLLFGVVIFFIGTDGFQAFTTESARSYQLMQNQPSFPPVTLEDSNERTYSFNEFADGKYVFITFMYTNCGTVCPQLEFNMADVYQSIPEKYIGEDIVFLSISFDPTRDTPEVLAKYRTYFDSDGETWRMARVNQQDELNRMLDTLGVVVIPDNNGNFQHNSAFYLIGQNGRLLEVMDYTKIQEASETVLDYLGETEDTK